MPMTEKLIRRSIGSGLFGLLAISVLGALATHFVASHFGPSQFGILSLSLALSTTVQGLCEFGQTTILQREIARTPNKEAKLIGFSLGLRLAITIVATVIFSAIGAMLYGSHSFVATATIVCSMCSLPALAVVQVVATIFFQRHRNGFLVSVNVFQQCVYLLGVCLILFVHAQIEWIAMANGATTAIQAFIIFFAARKSMRIRPHFNLALWKSNLRMAAPLGAAAVLGSLYLRMDVLLLGLLDTRSYIGQYSVSIAICSFFFAIPGMLTSIYLPHLSRLDETWISSARDLLGLSWAVGSLSAIVIYIGAPLAIKLFAGSQYHEAIGPLRVLGFSVVSIFVSSAQSAIWIARGFKRKIAIISSILLVVNVVLNIVAIPILGIIGSAFATTLCESTGLVLLSCLLSREPTLGFRRLNRPMPSLIALAVVFLVSGLIGAPHQTDTWLVLLQIVFYVGMFAVLLLLMGGVPQSLLLLIASQGRHAKGGPWRRLTDRSRWRN